MPDRVDILEGEVRKVARGLYELNAHIAVHESGHAGIALPDVVDWVTEQFWKIPSPLRVSIYMYAAMVMIAIFKSLLVRITRPKRTVPAPIPAWMQ